MLNSVDLDVDVILNGKWVYKKQSQFKIACAQSIHFRRSITQIQQTNNYTPNAIINCLAYTILLDWKDVFDLEGNPLPYNKKNAAMALLNDPDLYTFVTEYSADLKNYQRN